MTAGMWLEQAVGHNVEGDLDAADALAVTAKIKAYAGVAWVLLVEAHNRKAHKALGYATWAEYVDAEFDMSRSRSYQLISQARVVMEISEAVSTTVDISEREARDLEPILAEAKAAAVEAAGSVPDDAPAEDRAAAVNAALDRLRTTAVQAKRPKPTETVTFNPESGYTTTSGSDRTAGAVAAGSGDDERDETPAPSPAPKVAPPVDPVLGYRARATTVRSQVRDNLLTLDPERVVETSDDTKAWADLSASLRGWLDGLDAALAGPKLKAVR